MVRGWLVVEGPRPGADQFQVPAWCHGCPSHVNDLAVDRVMGPLLLSEDRFGGWGGDDLAQIVAALNPGAPGLGVAAGRACAAGAQPVEQAGTQGGGRIVGTGSPAGTRASRRRWSRPAATDPSSLLRRASRAGMPGNG